MLKLHQIYFKKFTFLFIALFIIVWAITYYSFRNIYIEQIKNDLLDNIKILSLSISNKTDKDLLVKKLKKNLHLRITIINKDGVVIAESDKDKRKLENHKNRAEILESNHSESGYSIRHSATLNINLLYVAKKFKIDNQVLYIRMAKPINQINQKLHFIALSIGFVLIVFFLLAFYVAYRISQNLENEVSRISIFLSHLTKKRKDTFIESGFSQEFSQIAKLLTKISQILTKQDKKKSKYTAKLKLANTQKDDIISAISHEFKNPIAVINGYSQTLLDDASLNSEIRIKFLKKINNNGDKLSKLIDKLRLSIKLDEKTLTPHFTDVNIYNLIEQNIEDIEQNFKDRTIIFSGNNNLVIKSDKTLIEIAITNLIENALKYSEDNVEVTIDENSVSIKDEGFGISPREIEKITKKFYRVSNNSWDNSLGLGLSIVSNIVNLHHFKLDIKSVLNVGSTFKIYFD